eukprot:364009-Chlamydomonas_euryale.AAC.4
MIFDDLIRGTPQPLDGTKSPPHPSQQATRHLRRPARTRAARRARGARRCVSRPSALLPLVLLPHMHATLGSPRAPEQRGEREARATVCHAREPEHGEQHTGVHRVAHGRVRPFCHQLVRLAWRRQRAEVAAEVEQ